MRAPPESLIPMTGQPIFAARSMILTIFSPMTSPSEPPKTVKSCEKTHTRRPSIVPMPVTTASPHGRFFSMSKSNVRWRTNVSSSWKEPGSSSFSTRSRAVILPLACCFSSASGFVCAACMRSSSSCCSFSSYVSGVFCRAMRAADPTWSPSDPELERERVAHALAVLAQGDDAELQLLGFAALAHRAPEAALDRHAGVEGAAATHVASELPDDCRLAAAEIEALGATAPQHERDLEYVGVSETETQWQ